MNLKRHVGALVAAVLLGSGLVGCVVEDERPVPYESEVTHTPKAKKTDADDGLDDDSTGEVGIDDDGAGEDGANESGRDAEALEPPPIPDAIYEETLEGAEAAAQYYLDALEYGFLARDPEPLEGICHELSETCANQIEEIELMLQNRRRFVIDRQTYEETSDLYYVDEGAIIEIPLYRPEYEVLGRYGNVLQSTPALNALYQMLAVYEGDRWRLRAITYEDLD